MTIKEFEIQEALGTLTDDMKCKLAQNPNTPIEVLVKLSTDKYWNIQYYVVANPNTPMDVIIKLALTKPWWGKDMPVRNPNIPRDILPKDEEHPSWWKM